MSYLPLHKKIEDITNLGSVMPAPADVRLNMDDKG
jgi:hypothetical protein